MDQVIVTVEPGADLPQIGKDLIVSSPLTGQTYKVRVKKIESMKWLDNGSIQVRVKGTRSKIDNPDAA